jgi:5-methylcytosine-specific restriction endonuclease McrA
MSTKSRKNKRKLLYDYQKGLCCYCSFPFDIHKLTTEHLRRKCEGGTDRIGNLALACSPCNVGRGQVDWMTYKSYILGEISL